MFHIKEVQYLLARPFRLIGEVNIGKNKAGRRAGGGGGGQRLYIRETMKSH